MKIDAFTHKMIADALREVRLFWMPLHAPRGTNAQLRALEKRHRAKAKGLPKRCAAGRDCLVTEKNQFSERHAWWKCARCLRWYHGDCAGADDAKPNFCDRCWSKTTSGKTKR